MSGSILSYNVGSDVTLTVVSNGALLVSQILTEFEPRQDTAKLKSVGIDGVNRHRDLEEGWNGTFQYDRADSTLDDYFAAKEAGRYAGQQPPTICVYQTINELSGAITKYRFDGVTMTLDSAGRWTGDNKVEMRVSWRASRRIKVQ